MVWKRKPTESYVEDTVEVEKVRPKPVPVYSKENRNESTERNNKWQVGFVPEQPRGINVIVNNETGEQLDLYEAIALLLNRTQ